MYHKLLHRVKVATPSQTMTPLLWYSTDGSILVPLTNSLYVPGRIKDKGNVIIDVGTGYFVKKVWRILLSQAVAFSYKGRQPQKQLRITNQK